MVSTDPVAFTPYPVTAVGSLLNPWVGASNDGVPGTAPVAVAVTTVAHAPEAIALVPNAAVPEAMVCVKVALPALVGGAMPFIDVIEVITGFKATELPVMMMFAPLVNCEPPEVCANVIAVVPTV